MLTLRPAHKRGGIPCTQTLAMTEIIHFIRQNSLLELNQFWYSYSWCNLGHISATRIYETLDHAFVTQSRISKYPRASVHLLSRVASDHHPLELKLHPGYLNPCVNLFVNLNYSNDSHVQEIIHSKWQDGVSGSPIAKVTSKLHHLRKHLRWHAKDNQGDINQQLE